MEIGKSSSRRSGEIICVIPMKLPSLNDYVRECRANRYKANGYKQAIEDEIAWHIRDLPRFESPVRIGFHWVEGSKRRDLDNIAFAKKFILDALVKCGKLKDDNRKCVAAFEDTFSYSDESKVILTIKELS